MQIFRNPELLDRDLLAASNLEEIPAHRLIELRERLRKSSSHTPLVSIVIAAWNEEVNIIRCVDTLSRSICKVPFEILVIDNNSTDRTGWVLQQLGVRTYFQPIKGCGPARQMGQENARGKYILLADADCLYPATWIQTMVDALNRDKVVCVYGMHSFLGTPDNPRWKFFLYEQLRNLMVEIRQVRRPYLNALGLSMGYIRELGLKEGFIPNATRGEDGRMCFDLMKYGEVRLIRSAGNTVWTKNRTLALDGNLFSAFTRRALQQLARLDSYFRPPVAHDTKTSENHEYSVTQSLDVLRNKYIPKFLRKKRRIKNHR